MTYLTSHTNASAASLDLTAPSLGSLRERSHSATDAKWPLWWTVLGVIAVCATFWTALFSIIL